MRAYLIPGVTGVLLGLVLHWAGFSRPGEMRNALALRRSIGLRSGLYALGGSMALTALLCWLAVIDVDTIAVLPLSAGVLLGGAVLGVAAGLSGFTPTTAFAGVGGGPVLEALCVLSGGAVMSLTLPWLHESLSALQGLPPLSAATLFQVTLDEPYLLGGGFLGQGCAGLLLMAIAVCVPSPRQPVSGTAVEPDEVTAGDVSGVPLLPAAAPEETFVALLPGEEPLVVDTALDDAETKADDVLSEEELLDEIEEEPENRWT